MALEKVCPRNYLCSVICLAACSFLLLQRLRIRFLSNLQSTYHHFYGLFFLWSHAGQTTYYLILCRQIPVYLHSYVKRKGGIRQVHVSSYPTCICLTLFSIKKRTGFNYARIPPYVSLIHHPETWEIKLHHPHTLAFEQSFPACKTQSVREWAISSNNRKTNPVDETNTCRLPQQTFGFSSSFSTAHVASSCWGIHLLSFSLGATHCLLLRLEEIHASQPVQLRDKQFERVLVPFPAEAIIGWGVSTPAPKPLKMVMAQGPSSLNYSELLACQCSSALLLQCSLPAQRDTLE